MVPFTFIIVLAVDWERPTIQELHILMIHQYSAAVISVFLRSIGCGIAPQVQCTVLQMFKNFRTQSSLINRKANIQMTQENKLLHLIYPDFPAYTISYHVTVLIYFLLFCLM